MPLAHAGETEEPRPPSEAVAGLLLVLASLTIVLAAYGGRRFPMWLGVALVVIVTQSVIAHKEYRFVLLAVVCLLVLARVLRRRDGGCVRLARTAAGSSLTPLRLRAVHPGSVAGSAQAEPVFDAHARRTK